MASKTKNAEEKKSARVQVMMTQQLFDAVTTLAHIKKCTPSELLCVLAAHVAARNAEAIARVQSVVDEVLPTVDLEDDSELSAAS